MKSTSFIAAILLCAWLPASAAPRALLAGESSVEFVVRQMGVPVAGAFKRFEAVVDVDAGDPGKSTVSVRIDIGSLDTGHEEADKLAVGPDWLDRARAPFATFRNTAIREVSKGRYEVRGPLGIKGRERDMAVPFTLTEQPGGRMLVSGEFVIRRSDWGIGAGVWNQPGVVAEEIPVKVRLVLAPPKPPAGAAAGAPVRK